MILCHSNPRKRIHKTTFSVRHIFLASPFPTWLPVLPTCWTVVKPYKEDTVNGICIQWPLDSNSRRSYTQGFNNFMSGFELCDVLEHNNIPTDGIRVIILLYLRSNWINSALLIIFPINCQQRSGIEPWIFDIKKIINLERASKITHITGIWS